MDNKTTVTSNDESRKSVATPKVEATKKEVQTAYVSDEEVRKDIQEKWGEDIYVAAIDAEFIENLIDQENNATSSSAAGGIKRRRIKVTSKVSKALNSLIIDPLVTVGAKKQNEKTKIARKVKEKAKAEKQKAEFEKE